MFPADYVKLYRGSFGAGSAVIFAPQSEAKICRRKPSCPAVAAVRRVHQEEAAAAEEEDRLAGLHRLEVLQGRRMPAHRAAAAHLHETSAPDEGRFSEPRRAHQAARAAERQPALEGAGAARSAPKRAPRRR